MTPDGAETELRVGRDRPFVVGRRVDRQAMVTTAVDELDGEGPDGIGTEPASLGVGAQEEVDAGVSEVGLVFLDRLDISDDLAAVLDDERVFLGIAVDEFGHDPVQVERAPPSGHRGLSEDRRQRRRVRESRRAEDHVPAAQFHGARVAPRGSVAGGCRRRGGCRGGGGCRRRGGCRLPGRLSAPRAVVGAQGG